MNENSPCDPHLDEKLKASDPEVQRFVLALQKENARLERQIAKLQAQNVTSQSQISRLQDERDSAHFSSSSDKQHVPAAQEFEEWLTNPQPERLGDGSTRA
jgi:predicted  nucleic acid-binding Zn-ribbon protein